MIIDAPFKQNQILDLRQNRTLALAGIFQAAQLTHITAIKGLQNIETDHFFYFEKMIKACLTIRPTLNSTTQTLDFFSQLSDISLGLNILEKSITQPFTSGPKSRLPKLSNAKLPLTYAMALLQLEKRIYKNKEFVEIIELSQQQTLKQLSFFNQNYLHPSIIASLAQIYVDTAGQINARIIVRGNVDALNDTHHVNTIRASLFTGLQMAHLWRQLGGSSWNMIFSKRKLLLDIKAFAKLQHQTV